MQRIFADFHIHIGRTYGGKAVKITASPNLTLPRILETAFLKKGMQMIGIIDCHVPAVIGEIEHLVEQKYLIEQEEGGLLHEKGCLVLGSEIEIYDAACNGPIHVLVYLPHISSMKRLSNWLSKRMTNYHLSSQRYYGPAIELQKITKKLGGLFVIAHAFTPFKSMYGKGVLNSLTEVFNPTLIDAVELGLSSDSQMAAHISELAPYPFMTNSDAHSLEKIAREYQVLEVANPTFKELQLALLEKEGRNVSDFFGLNPKLGKYYRTCCASCHTSLKQQTSSWQCAQCGSTRFIKGVFDRIQELARIADGPKQKRPPYTHQVPLDFIPGIGPSRLASLRKSFNTDMNVIHTVPKGELEKVLPKQIVNNILLSRSGKLKVNPGGGGVYGKVH